MKKTFASAAMLLASIVSIAAPASISRAADSATRAVTAVRSYPDGRVFVFLRDFATCSNRVIAQAGTGKDTAGILSIALAAQLSGREVRFEYDGSGTACNLKFLDIVE